MRYLGFIFLESPVLVNDQLEVKGSVLADITLKILVHLK
jgi:hypothetical protein